MGRKLDINTRNKISKGNKGKVRTIAVKEAVKERYSGAGNPNAGNFTVYCNMQNGIFYTTPEMYKLFDKTKSGLRFMFSKKDNKISNFIKV
jgi:hypothetical protein